MKFILYLLSFFFINQSIGQSFEGNWVGNMNKNIFLTNPTSINLELQKINDSAYTGVLHLLYKRNGFEHTKVSVVYHKKDSTFFMKEDSTLSYKIGFFSEIILGINKLKFSKTDSTMLLNGKWTEKKRRGLFVINIKERFVKKLDLPKVINQTKRIDDVQRVIDLPIAETDSIELKIYDNGVVDNDSISVLLNDKYILQNKRITAEPITCYITLDKNIKLHKLILFAVNLGEYPPNTAYMTIKTKKHNYSINLSSNFEKNGTVEFQLME